MKVHEIMITNVIQIAPAETVAMAATTMSETAVGCLVITVGGAVKGIVTDRDLLACLAEKHDPYTCPISSHMHHPVTVLRPEEEMSTAAEVMRRKRIKRLPVAKDGRLLGILSLSDLAFVAGTEAKRLAPSIDFFTAVIRAQSSQQNLPRAVVLHSEPSADSVDATSRQETLHAGAPKG